MMKKFKKTNRLVRPVPSDSPTPVSRARQRRLPRPSPGLETCSKSADTEKTKQKQKQHNKNTHTKNTRVRAEACDKRGSPRPSACVCVHRRAARSSCSCRCVAGAAMQLNLLDWYTMSSDRDALLHYGRLCDDGALLAGRAEPVPPVLQPAHDCGGRGLAAALQLPLLWKPGHRLPLPHTCSLSSATAARWRRAALAAAPPTLSGACSLAWRRSWPSRPGATSSSLAPRSPLCSSTSGASATQASRSACWACSSSPRPTCPGCCSASRCCWGTTSRPTCWASPSATCTFTLRTSSPRSPRRAAGACGGRSARPTCCICSVARGRAVRRSRLFLSMPPPPPPPACKKVQKTKQNKTNLTRHMLAAAAAAAAVAAAAVPFPAPDATRPWLFFGANETGPIDSALYLALAANSSLAGYGWQNDAAPAGFRHGEANLLTAARALAAEAPSLPVFVYRHFQMAWRLFDVTRSADDDPGARGMFLRDDDNAPGATECRQSIPGGGTSPLLVFTDNSSAGAFWVDRVIGEVAAEPGVAALFMDETDWSACGYNFTKDGCGNISAAFRARDLAAKLPAIRGTADALLAARKWPIFSSKNLLAAAWQGLPASAPRPCVVPHDAYAAALAGVSYGRFYEFWMGQGGDLDAATIANVLLEGAAGNVGLIARAGADAAAQCAAAACTEGAVAKASLSYALAAFLVARTAAHSYFGVSAGWYSPCWCWHAEYDAAAACGAPAAAAVRVGPHAWTRAYERCTVAVNTSAATGSFTQLQR